MMPGARTIHDPEAEMNRLAAERKISPRVRQVLDEGVTVVKPGETLIIRVASMTPMQHREYQHMLDEIVKWRGLPFQVMVVVGDEIGVGEPPA